METLTFVVMKTVTCPMLPPGLELPLYNKSQPLWSYCLASHKNKNEDAYIYTCTSYMPPQMYVRYIYWI